jgi:CHAT domain-containing protein
MQASSLADIIQLSRPQGGLAFLSACQTAQGDETLPEESVHLAAGMLLAGYGGVIATMWTIRDDDTPKVARDVYKHKVPDNAVRRLSDSGASLTSWVPFIHVGK